MPAIVLVSWAAVLFAVCWWLASRYRRGEASPALAATASGLLGASLPIWLSLSGAMKLSIQTILIAGLVLGVSMAISAAVLFPRWFGDGAN